jgi:quinol monooxygenase YgiN
MIDHAHCREDPADRLHLSAKFQLDGSDEPTAMRLLTRLATTASSLPGCRGCIIARTGASTSHFVLLEEWDSEEFLERHIGSEAFRAILGHFGACLRETIEGEQGDRISLRVSRSQCAIQIGDDSKP